MVILYIQNMIMYIFSYNRTRYALDFLCILISVHSFYIVITWEQMFLFYRYNQQYMGALYKMICCSWLYCIYNCTIQNHVVFLFVAYLDVCDKEHVDYQQGLEFCDKIDKRTSFWVDDIDKVCSNSVIK